jgi:hypothetical protein
VPSAAVTAPEPPTTTEACNRGAPDVLVTVPVIPPEVTAALETWMIFATEGTPEPFRIKSM